MFNRVVLCLIVLFYACVFLRLIELFYALLCCSMLNCVVLCLIVLFYV